MLSPSCSMHCASTGAGSAQAHRLAVSRQSMAYREVILSPPGFWSACQQPPNAPALSASAFIPIPCATALPLICLKLVLTCAPFRCCWVIVTWKKRHLSASLRRHLSATAVHWMHSRSEEKENSRRTHERPTSGGGRHRSLCRNSPSLNAVASGSTAIHEKVLLHHTLPYRSAGEIAISAQIADILPFVQLVSQPALSPMPGQRPPTLASGAGTGVAARQLRARRLHAAAGTGSVGIADKRLIYNCCFTAGCNSGRRSLAIPASWSRDWLLQRAPHLGSTLQHHPHVHCVLAAGGLATTTPAGSHRAGPLLPVKVLGRVFRGKFCRRTQTAFHAGASQFHGQSSYPLANRAPSPHGCGYFPSRTGSSTPKAFRRPEHSAPYLPALHPPRCPFSTAGWIALSEGK